MLKKRWVKWGSVACTAAMVFSITIGASAESANTAEADTWVQVSVHSVGEIKVDEGEDVWLKASDLTDMADNLNILGADYKQTRTRVRDDIAAGYSAYVTYDKGDYVMQDGKLCISRTYITTPEEFASSHWGSVVLGSEVKVLNEQVNDLYKQVDRIDGELDKIDQRVTEMKSDFSGWF